MARSVQSIYDTSAEAHREFFDRCVSLQPIDYSYEKLATHVQSWTMPLDFHCSLHVQHEWGNRLLMHLNRTRITVSPAAYQDLRNREAATFSTSDQGEETRVR